ncbi:MAG TPA: hypothetical protein PK624_12815 [Spirochaetota bacterium]|nr:hypothetical protein [Spirochaetota bacterium]HOR45667.1 hypothetical protein [Spirochaetota bacterium]HPK57354.1 hypothetical protein [Spirochaetota bacterium]
MRLKSLLKCIVVTVNDTLFAISIISLGLWLYLNNNKSDYGIDYFKNNIFAVIVIGSGLVAAYNLRKNFKRPKSLIRKYNKEYEVDIQTYKVLRMNIPVLFSFLLSIFLIIAFACTEYKNEYTRSYLLKLGIDQYYLYLFSVILIIFTIYGLGYSIIGELLQSKYGKRRRLIIFDLIIDIAFLFPFVAALSILSLIFIVVKNKNVSYVICKYIISIKYLMYFTMAAIAYEDVKFAVALKKSDLKDKSNRYMMNYIETNKGSILLNVVLLNVSFLLYNLKYNIIPMSKEIYIFAVTIIIYSIYCLLCEQIIIYKHYLNSRNIEI